MVKLRQSCENTMLVEKTTHSGSLAGGQPGGSLPVRCWGIHREPVLGEKPSGSLATVVPCLRNYAVTNSLHESELCKLLTEKLDVLLVQCPAVTVTKL